MFSPSYYEREARRLERQALRSLPNSKVATVVAKVPDVIKMTLTLEINGKIDTIVVEDSSVRSALGKLSRQVQVVENADKIAEIIKGNEAKKKAKNLPSII